MSFLQDTASELLYPLLSIYLTTVLGAPSAVVGAIEGAAEGAASPTKLASGFAVLIAGVWAGVLWGADGQLPLLISGGVGAVLAVGLLAWSLSQPKGGAPTPVTE